MHTMAAPSLLAPYSSSATPLQMLTTLVDKASQTEASTSSSTVMAGARKATLFRVPLDPLYHLQRRPPLLLFLHHQPPRPNLWRPRAKRLPLQHQLVFRTTGSAVGSYTSVVPNGMSIYLFFPINCSIMPICIALHRTRANSLTVRVLYLRKRIESLHRSI